jgi:hypothetical protein
MYVSIMIGFGGGFCCIIMMFGVLEGKDRHSLIDFSIF